MMDDALIRQVEQFVYREARLLDERRFREWLELFTEELLDGAANDALPEKKQGDHSGRCGPLR